MELYYEGSDGSIINFMQHPLYTAHPETLTKSHWDYSTISGVNGLGRVKRFYKDTQECTLKVSVMADDDAEFNRIMYDMHRTFDRDVRRLKPGRLWWNGFYKEVFAVDTSQSEFEELFEAVEREIRFISVYPYWVRKTTYSYVVSGVTGATGLDYDNYDYDYDYDVDDVIEVVRNDCISKANFEIKFFGPCQNPTVMIGGHSYSVLVNLSAGEYCTVNSLTKKILKYDVYGNEENVFYLRDRDSYIFEQIPEGEVPIIRNENVPVEITIFDERGEPEWI